ncbi:DUF1569 domain-containing protein [Pontibacter actiniarum]|uniref:DUF1569 domain-containing protein n=1 Tax=Pontibacter actiniarum TaxID=323450 RepID=A0A1X9YPY4_9BACT|nr:DUF1569 domain-containing protein [Pontibacter actiniarum]ARS34933.1 hypothetical protein CA264_05470 [Pontibacter actiniarum]
MTDIIHGREEILALLRSLKADRQPAFGIMTPQHMVEHLAFTVRFSNGKLPQQLYYREEKAQKFKQYTIYSDREMVPGFRAPMLTEALSPLAHADLPEAIEALGRELEAFDSFFLLHPDEKPVNPTMGALTYQEWVTFHNKHFRHHLRQYNLA